MSEQLETTVSIPKDLQDKVGALRAIATCHNLIDKGSYNVKQLAAVEMSIEFLRALYESAKAEALAHPDADLVPELAALKGSSNE